MSSLFIFLYAGHHAPVLDLGEVASHISARLPSVTVEVREDPVQRYLATRPPEARDAALSALASRVAAVRVRSATQRRLATDPLYGEVQYEKRRLSGGAAHSFGVMYEGFAMMHLLQELMAPQERSLQNLHIVLTNQLFGTWEEGDRRYHARAVVCGLPSLISTTGIVEAPAKPREYYLLKQQYQMLGMEDAAEAGLAPRFRGRFIEHGDSRMGAVVKGYVLQAVFHHLTGEAFCDSRDCRLYNAHWQEELIHAQLRDGAELCHMHAEKLRELNESISGHSAPGAGVRAVEAESR